MVTHLETWTLTLLIGTTRKRTSKDTLGRIWWVLYQRTKSSCHFIKILFSWNVSMVAAKWFRSKSMTACRQYRQIRSFAGKKCHDVLNRVELSMTISTGNFYPHQRNGTNSVLATSQSIRICCISCVIDVRNGSMLNAWIFQRKKRRSLTTFCVSNVKASHNQLSSKIIHYNWVSMLEKLLIYHLN